MTPKLLVIDDAVEIHALLEARLQPEEIIMDFATNAEEGFERAKSIHPDLILLDVMMPGISGFDLCRMLKEDPDTSSIPVIFLSGATDSVDKIKGLDLGAIDYITKPFDPAELRARVRSGLRTKRFQDLLAERAQIDWLTGLWNTIHFERRLFEMFSAARRYDRPFSVILLDLDHLNSVNNQHGRPVGDKVLHAVAALLLDSTRTCDIVCRNGDDEFAILLPETIPDQATFLAQRICAGIKALRVGHRGDAVQVTGTLGVAGVEHGEDARERTAQSLFDGAKASLEHGRSTGRDRVGDR
ncbi:MAG: diguanylate cyclase [Deltaproteobacteria bacterium]|jgi:two-component system, cell cycle response regulator|nr:diguanylate cyclase [Deltaproteobacteria bacterium]MBT6435122.1 diguanylate cyclase [Deltaproteobacteria bacterium]MBT6490344.1 diguanylate cyclase [Deltaproteobacteria bacterium]